MESHCEERAYPPRRSDVQALVPIGLRFRQPVHSFDQADFGLAQASHEVGERAYRGFQFGEALVVLGGRRLKTGVRMALGAERLDVWRMVLADGARLTLVGVGIGAAAALGLTRLMSSMLFGVKPTDPLTFASVALLLCAIALLACCLPARRAMRVDPMVALRYE